MQVKRLTNSDVWAVNYIVENLIDAEDEKPSNNHLQKLLTDDRTYLYAAISGEDVIAYAFAFRFPSLYSSDYMAYLYDIEVVEKHRKQGVGRQLIGSLKADLEEDGVTELWLGTATDNTAGQALFSSTGGIRSDETFNDFTYEF